MHECKTYINYEPRLEATDLFIAASCFTLNRTPAEILAKLGKAGERGVFDFSGDVYMDHLPWELAKPYYTPETVQKVESGALPRPPIPDLKETAQDFLDYLNFAWGKAVDQRGLSAMRSIQKLSAWLWLLGRDDLVELIEDERLYSPYGAPALVAVSDALRIPVPAEVRAFASDQDNAVPEGARV